MFSPLITVSICTLIGDVLVWSVLSLSIDFMVGILDRLPAEDKRLSSSGLSEPLLCSEK